MATLNSRKLVDEFIANNGYMFSDSEPRPDNPPVKKIVEYTNAWDKVCYGIIFAGEIADFRYERESEFIRNPRVLWRHPDYYATQQTGDLRK